MEPRNWEIQMFYTKRILKRAQSSFACRVKGIFTTFSGLRHSAQVAGATLKLLGTPSPGDPIEPFWSPGSAFTV